MAEQEAAVQPRWREENEEFNKMKNQPGENWFPMEAFGSLSFGCVGPG